MADDDASILDVVAAALEDRGFEVVRAASGAELVQHLAEDEPFAVVVTDIAMPWMSGLQAALSARQAGVVAGLVVMTALRDASLKDKVQSLGNAVLLRKPFGVDELSSAVAQVVRPD